MQLCAIESLVTKESEKGQGSASFIEGINLLAGAAESEEAKSNDGGAGADVAGDQQD